MLKKRNLVAAAFAGTFVYVTLSLSYGKDGIWAAKQLTEQKRLLSIHTDELQKLNNSLELEYNALRNDPEVISAFAKKLDYVADGEKIVKINGLYTSDVYKYGTGTPIKSAECTYIPEWFCKLFSLLVYGVFILYYVFKDIQADFKRRKIEKSVKGIRVYDLSQI